MQKMEKITIEKKGDTFTQIITLYYIKISLFRINSALLQDIKRKKKYKRKEKIILLYNQKREILTTTLHRPIFWTFLQGYLQAEEESGRRDKAKHRRSTRGPTELPWQPREIRANSHEFWSRGSSGFQHVLYVFGFATFGRIFLQIQL